MNAEPVPMKRCSRCRESWPMDAAFFKPMFPGSRRFYCRCKACEATIRREARQQQRAGMAVPA